MKCVVVSRDTKMRFDVTFLYIAKQVLKDTDAASFKHEAVKLDPFRVGDAAVRLAIIMPLQCSGAWPRGLLLYFHLQ